MKSIRLAVVLALFGVSIAAILWVLGFIDRHQALDGSGRILAVVAILATTGFLSYIFLGGDRYKDNQTPDPKTDKFTGPKF